MDALVGVDLDDADQVLETLLGTPTFSSITAHGFLDGLSEFAEFASANPEITIARHARKAAVSSTAPAAKLAGKAFVFTGFRDAALKASIEALGGTVVDSISAKVSFVLAKDADDNSGKIQKARALGIPVIGRDDVEL
jgi:NAD-dependent DNA ligase